MSEEYQEQEADGITLPVDWHFPEGLISRYANNVLVQQGQYEMIISFFEMQIPMLSGSPEENKAILEKMDSIRAECVGKIIIPRELASGLINALQAELEKPRAIIPNQQEKGEQR